MAQESSESVRAFAARITGKADLCVMTVTCPCPKLNCNIKASHQDEVVLQVCLQGMSDEDIRGQIWVLTVFQKIGGDLLITSCFGGWVNLVRNHLSQFCEQLSSCHQVHMGVQLHHQVCDLPRLDLTIWVDAKNSYLLPSSNHPSHITKNIPNSLSLKNHEELWPGREEGVEVSGAVR